MKILLTNDDGIESEALHFLAKELQKISDLLVVVPRCQQSGASHSFTFYKSLGAVECQQYPYRCWMVEGTPSDCTKFAICKIFDHQLPDLIISGPNDGENAGIAVVYSGTIAGAREGALWGVPGISLSMKTIDERSLQFLVEWIKQFISQKMYLQISTSSIWNVNFPDIRLSPKPLTKLCKMGTVMYEDVYKAVSNEQEQNTEKEILPQYQLVGRKPIDKLCPEQDDYHFHVENNVTVVPLRVDQTHDGEYARLSGQSTELFSKF